MTLSVFDIFKIGIGPSSSHTVGPMIAARRFAQAIHQQSGDGVNTIQVELFGSLALTGLGHGTDRAVLLGLEGHQPDTLDPADMENILERIKTTGILQLFGRQSIQFNAKRHILFNMATSLPFHPNALRFQALDAAGRELAQETFYSLGGGFVVSQDETNCLNPAAGDSAIPFAFDSAAQLLELGRKTGLSLADMALANERARRGAADVMDGLDKIITTMNACVDRGCRQSGILPGGLMVERRAAKLHGKLCERQAMPVADAMAAMDWVNLWAMAVNEENAAGGRVVTAPTNGAAGIIPAVLRYYAQYCHGDQEGGRTFLLVAGMIGSLFKMNASISGAEVGCQGEVGVACSMAAAGLTAALGGTNEQIENAAEIGMEHNLGLTCDPIGGLVQIPCIERNAMGAIKAIDASRLAMLGDGTHKVSLDKVIATMRQTGADMSAKYKETSLGGLAVNIVEC